MRFDDRVAAGRALGEALRGRWTGEPPVVLGLPRGGVPVAAGVAAALSAPLDVIVVRKLGVPGQPELAMGAVAGGGVQVLNPSVIRELAIPDDEVERVTAAEQAEVARRERAFRGDRPHLVLRDRDVVLVDDGLATGATMRAAVNAVRVAGPARVVVAVPVASAEARDLVAALADEVVCLFVPAGFGAVGLHYRDFRQTTDDEVRRRLNQS